MKKFKRNKSAKENYNTAEYKTRSCRHCSEGFKCKKDKNNPLSVPYQIGVKRQKPIYKRRSDIQLYELVKSYIIEFSKKTPTEHPAIRWITAEEVAKIFQVKTHRVKHIFSKLNQEGLMFRHPNRPPHDCNREWGWGHDSGWIATLYIVHDSKDLASKKSNI